MFDDPRLTWTAAALSALSAVLAFVTTWFFYARNAAAAARLVIAADHQKLMERVVMLEQQLALVSAATAPVSAAFQTLLIKRLTHDGTPEMDALMVKIGPPYSMTHEDEKRLTHLLLERAELEGTFLTESERNAAKMLPWLIQMVNEEAASELASMASKAMSNPVAEKKAEEK